MIPNFFTKDRAASQGGASFHDMGSKKKKGRPERRHKVCAKYGKAQYYWAFPHVNIVSILTFFYGGDDESRTLLKSRNNAKKSV